MDIINLLLNLLTLLGVGLLLFPKVNSSTQRKATLQQIKRTLKPGKLGAIQKLTQEELSKKGTRLEETEVEMNRVLDEVL